MRFGGGSAAAGSLVLPFVRAGVTAAGVVAIGGVFAFSVILLSLLFSGFAGVLLLSIARLPLLRLAGWVCDVRGRRRYLDVYIWLSFS